MPAEKIRKYTKDEYMEMIGSAINKITQNKCLIIFFGSILTDRFDRTSDIDVGIYCKEPISGEVYSEILEEIDKLPMLKEVDIVDISKIKDKQFLKNILKGKIWINIPELMKDLQNRLINLEK